MDIGKIAAGLLRELDVESIRVEGMKSGIRMLLDAIREEAASEQQKDNKPVGSAEADPGSNT